MVEDQQPEGAIGMSPERFNKTQQWIRECADKLGLRDWTIRLSRWPAKDSSDADIWPSKCQRDALIRLNKDWESYTDKRAIMAHELIHCHFRNAEEVVYSSEDNLGKAVSNVLFENYRNAIEYGIDALAREICVLLPEYPQ